MDKRLVASRLLWFVGLWAAGVVTISIIGGIIKAAIAAGLLPLAWWGAGKLSREPR